MTGWGSCGDYVKSRPKNLTGPIVVLSNVGYEKVAEEAQTLGAAGFLTKVDLLPKDLLAAVSKYLVSASS